MRATHRTLAIAAALAVAVPVTAAVAGIPSGDGTIAGCYSRVGGVLRVIDADAGQTCHATKETAIEWNQRGPEGPVGATGPRGAVGAQGPQGDRGPAGPTASSLAGSYEVNGGLLLPPIGAVTVVSLEHSPRSEGKLVMPFDGRVMASATVELWVRSLVPGTTPVTGASCELQIAYGSTYRSMHPSGAPGFHTTGRTSIASVVGAADVPAGTYDVRVVCSGQGSEDVEVRALRRDLIVWGVAT
jgi:hypothetical protein